MFERFTERARHVVVLAQQEARALGHDHIGTEHLLLGLLREPGGTGARALEECGLALTDVRDCVTSLNPAAEPPVDEVIPIPFTPLAKKALELSLREALGLGHNYIGTEHVLLGLTMTTNGKAVQILLDCGLDTETIRSTVTAMLRSPALQVRRPSPPGPPFHTTTAPLLPADVRAFLAEIAREIRDQLGREPDIADYLLALASVPGSLHARLLSVLEIDAAALAQAIERVRAGDTSPLGGLTPDRAAEYARRMLGLVEPD